MNAISLKIAAAAAAVALLPAAPALAQQLPGIINNAVTETAPVRVTVNGVTGRMVTIGYDDVSVHRGRNTAIVRWDGPVKRIEFQIRYGRTEHTVKDVLSVRLDAAREPTLRRAGSRTYTFTIPG